VIGQTPKGSTLKAILTVVLDTHICLEWFLWDSPRLTPLRLAHAAGFLTLLNSLETRQEWRRVLAYPQFALSLERIDKYCADYHALAILTPTLTAEQALSLPKCRDLDDQKFLELSMAANAQFLITRDKKLRKIGRHKFYKAAGLQVLTLEAFLALNILPADANAETNHVATP
jgi:putative PIN family toxin of toxin-antitoxin system